MPYPAAVTIVEVGPRDGLQSIPDVIPTAAKLAYIRGLAAAGLSVIEVAGFVSPKWVPQLADAEAVCSDLPAAAGVRYIALVPNLQGYERAVQAGLKEVAVFTAASETFNQKNINTSINGSIDRFRPVVAQAKALGIPVRGYISTCFGCPYEGPVTPAKVAEVTARLFDLGIDEISLGDTIGVAAPSDVERVLDPVLARFEAARIALHMHDTRGTALANVMKGLEMGITIFDSSAGGLGGCPYAPGAAGNLATEDLVYALHRMGIQTGIDLDKLVEASRYMESVLGHPLPSRYLQAAGGIKSAGGDPRSA